MDNKNCSQCSQTNPAEMKFCLNCGAELAVADDLPPTVLGGFNANAADEQMTPPNFQAPNSSMPTVATAHQESEHLPPQSQLPISAAPKKSSIKYLILIALIILIPSARRECFCI